MSSDIIISIIFPAIIFIILVFLSGWIATKPVYCAWLIFGLILLDASYIPITFNFGMRLYPEDIFFLVLSISCLIRFSLFASLKTVPHAWWIIGIVQFILFIRGFQTYGTAAGVDYRGHFYLWVAVTYFCSIKWTATMINAILNSWLVCSIIICLMVYYRWIGSSLDPVYANEISALDPTGVRFRVVSSGSTLVIAIGFLILLFKVLSGKLSLFLRLLMPIMLLTVIVLQHRSVWISVIIGCGFLFSTLSQKKMKLKTIIFAALLAVFLTIFFSISGTKNGVIESIASSAENAVSTEDGTMVARVGNWRDMLANWATSKSAATYLIGKPYGSGYNPVESEDGTTTFDMVPHNHLVHILFRGGLIGLYATLYVFFQLCINIVKAIKTNDNRLAPYFLSVFFVLFAYYIPYWATYGHGIFIGIAISYFWMPRKQRLNHFYTSFKHPYGHL